MENNKKKLQIPSTCALLFMLMIVCAILTWIVPAGEFDTEKVGNLNKVIAGTYHTVDASLVGPWATIMAVVQGFYKAAKLMVMIMFVGGAAGVFANPVVALIPIGIILATNLGYDSFTGFLLVYMGAYSGFNVGWANASAGPDCRKSHIIKKKDFRSRRKSFFFLCMGQMIRRIF